MKVKVSNIVVFNCKCQVLQGNLQVGLSVGYTF